MLNSYSDELLEFAGILGQQTDFQEIIRLVAQKSAQFLNADLSLILMLNPDTRRTLKTIFKDGHTFDQKAYRDIHIHVGGWIVNKRKPFFTVNLKTDTRFTDGLFAQAPVQCVAGVPLIIEGIVIGALILLYGKSPEADPKKILIFLENLAVISAPFLRNAQKIREYFISSLPDSSLLIKYQNAGLYGQCDRFIELLRAIEAATNVDTRVLLIGKTGTGKERIARAVHMFSKRAGSPFLAADCGAIPDTLLESEFFGHVRGAFTGAQTERHGLFLEANNGTLFLDEINNMPFDMQSKFLRVLEDHHIRPVGSDRSVETNVRIIAASSMSLKEQVEGKRFREDLFYRLHVYPIYIPDLHERKEDIPLLANHFLVKFARQQNKKIAQFHEAVMDFMKQRTWEGNIRELENFIERIVTVIDPESSTIIPDIFPADLRTEFDVFREQYHGESAVMPIKEKLNTYESELIRKALIECNWNQSLAARQLQTSESNIRYKMIQYQIKRPSR